MCAWHVSDIVETWSVVRSVGYILIRTQLSTLSIFFDF